MRRLLIIWDDFNECKDSEDQLQVSQRKLPSSLNSLSSRPTEGSDQLLLHVQVGQPGSNTIFGVPYSIYYVSV